MSFEISTSTQYDLRSIIIVTKYGSYDIRAMFSELNMFDSIMQPCVSGNIVIVDSLGLNHSFKFDGTEFLKIEASKKEDNLRIKKTFRIYKETDRKNNNMNSETYVLHFVSDEFIFSQQKTLNNYYAGTYSEIVQMILEEKLGITVDNYIIEKSIGVREIVIPNLKPMDALLWCSKRALNNYNLPNFLFFENLSGYKFISLSTLKNQKPILDILFEPKNIRDAVDKEFFGARDLETITQFDYLDNLMSGVYSGTFVGFDPITRIVVEQGISFDDIFVDPSMNMTPNLPKDINKDNVMNTEMLGSKRIVYPTQIARQNTEYILTNDKKSINLKETPEYFALQRRAILKHLYTQRIKISLPGNFSITSGVTLNILKQKSSYYDETTNNDSSLFGKYLVVASRHILKDNKHETVLELVTDSKNVKGEAPIVNVKEAKK